MARLTIDRLTKSYGGTHALDDVSLEVGDGELLAVLGPSGCGKTTLLRQIAGFDRPDAGQIRIGDTIVSTPDRHVPPERRRIGIVFQSYALWPHMTVAENVAYGLEVAGVKRVDRDRRVSAALKLVELDGLGARRPALLSGGQRQRVALARCLVTEPTLVLLDEPLANLDVHLRASMEREFARLHEQTRTTMIYVTHDQAEAMALADRIAVMDRGRVRQVASPSELYREPADAVVARFVGEGIIVPIEVIAAEDGGCEVDLFGYRLRMRRAAGSAPAGPAQAVLRARALRVVAADTAGVRARVDRAIYRGGQFRLEARLEAKPDVKLHFAMPEPCTLTPGTAIKIAIDDAWILPTSKGDATACA